MPTFPTSPPYSCLRPGAASSSSPSSEWASALGVSREDSVEISDRKSEKSFWSPASMSVPVVPKLLLKQQHEEDAEPHSASQDPVIESLERALIGQVDATEFDQGYRGDRLPSFDDGRVVPEPLTSPPSLIDLARPRSGPVSKGNTEGPLWQRKRKECERLRRIIRGRTPYREGVS
ncbi:hypothetical protein FOZ61_003645 [Perkinsus olseni]|uniref:Uncharacterized protein n=1 Tax=Perkinsus olseni TaxID=32597 RepID=A0A7J6LP30_PEROL|nr:hypothetical protein FOL46_006178 [Perkinsus olseni]KAF4660974.1 hypothetical protein FOZ61_003645 [Perkinsus olseni]